MKKIIYLSFVFLFFLKISYAQYDWNWAANFDGVNSYIAVPNSSNLSPSTAITVEAWVYPEGTTGTKMAVVGKNRVNNYYDLRFKN